MGGRCCISSLCAAFDVCVLGRGRLRGRIGRAYRILLDRLGSREAICNAYREYLDCYRRVHELLSGLEAISYCLKASNLYIEPKLLEEEEHG